MIGQLKKLTEGMIINMRPYINGVSVDMIFGCDRVLKTLGLSEFNSLMRTGAHRTLLHNNQSGIGQFLHMPDWVMCTNAHSEVVSDRILFHAYYKNLAGKVVNVQCRRGDT